MAKYSEGDWVVLHPNVTGQYAEYEGRTGMVISLEADALHHHLGGVAQYRVRVEPENPVVTISVSEKELTRARRGAGDHSTRR